MKAGSLQDKQEALDEKAAASAVSPKDSVGDKAPSEPKSMKSKPALDVEAEQ